MVVEISQGSKGRAKMNNSIMRTREERAVRMTFNFYFPLSTPFIIGVESIVRRLNK